jgi:YVTN family beta-propeller protein
MCEKPLNSTILDYAINTSPNPLQLTPEGEPSVDTTLTIIVSNNTNSVVQCRSIQINIPFGVNAKNLTSEDYDTQKPDGWDLDKDGGRLTATPHAADAGKIGRHGLTFILSNVHVNSQPGTVCVTITEETVDESGNVSTGTRTIDLVKGPRVQVLTFTGPSKPIFNGTAAMLSWETSVNADRCGLMVDKQFIDQHAPSSTTGYTVFPSENLTYTLFAYSPDGTASIPKTCSVEVVSAKVAKTVKLDLTPWALAASPDGKTVYVGEYNSDTEHGYSQIVLIDTTTNQVTKTDHIIALFPAVAVAPDGAHLYIASDQVNRIYVLDTKTKRVVKQADLKTPTGHIAVSPDGAHLYITSGYGNELLVVDTAKMEITARVDLLSTSFGVAVSPDGARVYVCTGNGCVSLIDASQNNLVGTVPVGESPNAVTVSRDGARVYAAQSDNSLSVIDTSTNQVIAKVEDVGQRPMGVAVSPDGALVFVAAYGSDGLTVIDATNNTIVQTVKIEGGPNDVIVLPSGKEAYVISLDGKSFSQIEIPNTKLV